MTSSATAMGPLQRARAAAAPLAKSALLRLGGYAAIRRLAPSHRLAILRYHAVCGPAGAAYAARGISVTPESFEAHVACLVRSYAVLRLEDAVRLVAEHRPLPPNAVAITFDDGYADNLAAARTLARYGASATFYLTAGCLDGGAPFWPAELRHLLSAMREPRTVVASDAARVEVDVTTDAARTASVRRLTKAFKSHPIPVREDLRRQLRRLSAAGAMPRVMLTWDEVREMHALGMTIGSHTMTHPNLPSAGIDAARLELTDARARIEAEIGAPVTMFSYPNGGADRYMTPDVQRLVREAGYAAATTSRNAFAGPGSDVFALERVQVQERLADLLFALEVERFILQPTPREYESS